MKLFLSLALLAAFLLCPAACADGVHEGLSLAAAQALPALFPFFVVSGLLVRCDTARLSPLLAKPLARLYGLPPEAAPALVLGLIGGYPVGAATACALLSEGVLSREAAERVNRFCNCASPGFCIGLVGLGVFGSARAGAMLYGIHIVSALLVGLCFARTPLSAVSQRIHNRNRTSFPSIFCASVQQAASTALTVTAFLTMFSILLRLLSPVFAFLPYGNAFAGFCIFAVRKRTGRHDRADQRLRRAGRAAAAAQDAADACVLPAGIWRTGCAVSGARPRGSTRFAGSRPVCRKAAARYARSCADSFPVFPLACRADGFLTGADTVIGTVPVYACCAVRFRFVSNLGVEKAQEMIYNILYTSCIDRHHSTGHFYH